MFIRVSKTGDSFSFCVGDNPLDDREGMIDSSRDFFLFKDVRPYYFKHSDAYLAAYRIAHFLPSMVLAKKACFYRHAQEAKDVVEISQQTSPKDDLVSFYSEQMSLLSKRYSDILEGPEKDRKEMLQFFVNEIKNTLEPLKTAIEELDEEDEDETEALQKISDWLNETMEIAAEKGDIKLEEEGEQTGGMPDLDLSGADLSGAPGVPAMDLGGPPPAGPAGPVMASAKKSASKSLFVIKDQLLDYAAKMCSVVDGLCGNVRIERIDSHTEDGKPGHYSIRLANEKGPVLLAKVNGDLFLTSVRPAGDLEEKYPYHSIVFYERVLEPVLSSVGHMMWNGLVACANHPQSKRFKMAAFDPSTQKESIVAVLMGPTWAFSKQEKKANANFNFVLTAGNKFAPSDLVEGTWVKCINNALPVYHNRTGVIKKAIPRTDYVDITVDFGRGLDEVVLTDKDVELFAP